MSHSASFEDLGVHSTQYLSGQSFSNNHPLLANYSILCQNLVSTLFFIICFIYCTLLFKAMLLGLYKYVFLKQTNILYNLVVNIINIISSKTSFLCTFQLPVRVWYFNRLLIHRTGFRTGIEYNC